MRQTEKSQKSESKVELESKPKVSQPKKEKLVTRSFQKVLEAEEIQIEAEPVKVEQYEVAETELVLQEAEEEEEEDL